MDVLMLEVGLCGREAGLDARADYLVRFGYLPWHSLTSTT
jgi:hypothetical protein